MNKTTIPYQQTGFFSKLMLDYLEEKEELKPFYNQYCDIDSFKRIIEKRKQFDIDRSVLASCLAQQYAKVEASELTMNNIQNLNNDNCFSVTTGHQLNLFTGPVYFIYKIISTINLAKELKNKYPENDFVPVYWMATEDHDFEEVNHFNLFKKRYELTKTQIGAVGRMKLEGVEEIISELKEDLGDRSRTEEVLALISKFYVSSTTYTEAIKRIVNLLFGKYGLVIMDGDNSELKKLFIDEFKNELLDRKNHQLINSTSEQLKTLGFKQQVTPREINLFYLINDVRERIVFEANAYQVLNTEIRFSETEIIEELENHPERFSPNAPIRCMYQEKVLPNLAYIGGGAELAYWFQLKDMFNANDIPFPILVLRNSVLFVDSGTMKKLQKLNLDIVSFFKPIDEVVKNFVNQQSEEILNLTKEQKELKILFNQITQKAKVIDQSLDPMVKGELQKSLKSLEKIENRLIKAEKQKQELSVNQIISIKKKLFPNQFLQERHDNLISLLLFYGEDVIEELITQLNPLDKQFTIIVDE